MKTVLVFGATGAMGQAVIKKLAQHNWHIKAFTRNTQNQRAQALQEEFGAELIQGNNDSIANIENALVDVDAVFCNTDFWTNLEQPENERTQMLNILQLCEKHAIDHVVFSSLENCSTLSNGAIPVTHFDSKAIVEQEINWKRSLEHFHQKRGYYSTHVTVLRTLPYFENLMSYFVPVQQENHGEIEHVFQLPLGKNGKMAMVALDDIGWFAHHIFSHKPTYGGSTLAIGSDTLSGKEMADTFTKVTGRKASYSPISDNDFLKAGFPAHDALNHFVIHREIGIQRDYETLRNIHPGLLNFEAWLIHTGWKGEPRNIQKKLTD